MQEFDNIKDMVYCELDEISRQKKLDMNTVEILGELVDILKDIGSIEMFEEGINIQEDDLYGYSRNGDGHYQRGYSQRRMPIYYDNGNSYRGGNYGGSYGTGYRRDRGGYSRADGKDHMIKKLHDLMNEAQDNQDREAISRLIDQMNHGN